MAEKFRETEIVADRHTAIPAFEISHYRFCTWLPEVTFPDDLTGFQFGFKQMDFAIGGSDFPPPIEQDAGVVDA